jgi:hypothetical protein
MSQLRMVAWLLICVAATAYLYERYRRAKVEGFEGFEVLTVRLVAPAVRVPFVVPKDLLASDAILRELSTEIQYLTTRDSEMSDKEDALVVRDVATSYAVPKSDRLALVAVLPRSFDFVMIRLLDRGDEPGRVPFEESKASKFGYADPACKFLLEGLAGAYGLGALDHRASTASAFMAGEVDVWCALRHEDAAEPVEFLGERKIRVIAYEDLDVSKLKMRLPFAYTRHVDVRKHFAMVPQDLALVRTLKLDLGIFVRQTGRRPEFSNAVVKKAAELLVRGPSGKEVLSRTTYYARHFEVHPSSDVAMRALSNRLASRLEDGLRVGRPEHEVLEQFVSRPPSETTAVPLDLVADGPGGVDVFFRYDDRFPWVKHATLAPGSTSRFPPLRAGDRLRLTRQARSDENDAYVVVSATRAEVRASTYPTISAPNAEIETKEEPLVALDLEDRPPEITIKLRVAKKDVPAWFRDAKEGTPVVLVASKMRVAARVLAVDDATIVFVAESRDPRRQEVERCVTHGDRPTRTACESDRTAMGTPQPRGTWDRPCSFDSDCPFYQKNVRYFNHRGGCLPGGYCEMPIGVRRVGHRKYEGKPSCHGCPDGKTECCDEQGAAPDYAFDLDEFERNP